MEKFVMRLLKGILIVMTMVLTMNPGLLSDDSYAASYEYSYSDQASQIEIKGSRHYLDGNHMVWIELDSNGKSQVFYQQIEHGEKIQITDHNKPLDAPRVDEDNSGKVRILWEDKRNYAGGETFSYNWDIYAYDLESEEEWKLNSTEGQHGNISMDGHLAVWMKSPDEDLYLYNLQTRQETYVGKGRFPVISGGRIVFMSDSDGGLMLHTLATGITERILELPYHQYVDWFGFKNSTVVWKQKDLDMRSHYVMMNLDDGLRTPVSLTQPSVKPIEYSKIQVGDSQAAWLEYKNGSAQIVGADLLSGQTHQITSSNERQELFGFQGDQVLTMNDDHQLAYKTIIRKEMVSAPETVANTDELADEWISGSKSMDGDGGLIELDGASLTVPEGTFDELSLVELLLSPEKIDLSQLPKPDMTILSNMWEIRSERAFLKPVELTVVYESTSMTPDNLEKAALYHFNPETSVWEYAGGLADSKTSELSGEVSEPGIYAIMLYEPTFGDIKGHWAKHTIEILASRWIVSGMSDTEFQPNASLTRAQFTKLLADAAGLQLHASGQSTFSDVPAQHWGYAWIEAAAEAGWITGYNGKFQPDDRLSREQMMTMLVKAMDGEQEALSLTEAEINEALAFEDANKVSNWAKPYAAWIVNQGLIKGSEGKLEPVGTSNRAQGATVIYGWLKERGDL